MGNEAVGTHTKEAAQGASSALASQIIPFERPLPVSKAVAMDAGAKEFKVHWLEEWALLPQFCRISLFDSAKPSNAVAKIYNRLSRLQCSILTQLCTTHLALNTYLYRFHLAPSPDCKLCLGPETIPHYLLSCPHYRCQRLDLVLKLGTVHLSLRRLLATKSDSKPVLRFMRDTGHFPCYTL